MEFVADSRYSYPIRSPHPGWAEQDPLAWRRAALSGLTGLVRKLPARRSVVGIGLTGQCPSFVLVDAGGRPVTAGLLYRDNRADAEAAEVVARFGADQLHRLTGHTPASFHIAPKLMWLKRHYPSTVEAAAWLLQPRDFVGLELTGEVGTDGSHAAATLLYDLLGGVWHHPTVEALGFDAGILPPLFRSTSILGQLRPSIASRIGVSPGIPVVIGGADSQSCALGAGVIAAGPVSEMAGSSSCLNAAVPTPLECLEISHFPHVIPGVYCTETGINTTGAAVAWLAGLLYGSRRGRVSARDYARLGEEAAAVPAGAGGVVALPALGDGDRRDAGIRAALVGLSARHDRGVIARAMLEAVAFGIREQLETLGEFSPVTELRVSGGGARIRGWGQIKADVTGVPVETIPLDAASRGVAMLAGLGISVYGSVDEAVGCCVPRYPMAEPDEATRGAYDAAYRRYRDLAASPVVRSESE